MKLFATFVTLIFLSGCTSKNSTSQKSLLVKVSITDLNSNEDGSGKTVINTNLRLEPNKRTVLGGLKIKKSSSNEIYSISAIPMGDVIRFVIFRGNSEIGKMQILNQAGELGTIKNEQSFQKIVLQKSYM